jgi:streptogramin lyase
MYAHIMEPPPSATALRPDLPTGVDPVLAKAMAKRSDDRYASAGDLAAALGAAVGDRLPEPKRVRSRASVWVVIGAALVLGLVVAIVAVADGNRPRRGAGRSPVVQASTVPPASLAMIDPVTGEPARVFRDLPGLSSGTIFQPNLSVGEGAAWLYSFPVGFSAFITHIDDQTGEVRDRLTVTFFPGAGPGLAVGSRTVWFSGEEPGDRVSGINPLTDEPLEPVSIRTGLVTDIVLGDDELWVGSSEGTLTAFDPLTGKRLDEIPIGGTPDAIAYGADSVWAIDVLANEVIRVDPVRRKVVARIPLAGNLKDVAAGDGGVWVLDEVAGTVVQIDPGSNSPASPIRLGPASSGIAVGFGFAWVTDAEEGNLYRVDPQLDRATPIRLERRSSPWLSTKPGRRFGSGVSP